MTFVLIYSMRWRYVISSCFPIMQTSIMWCKIYCMTNLCECKYSSRWKNLVGTIVKGSWKCIKVLNDLFEYFAFLSFKRFPQKSWHLIRVLSPYTWWFYQHLSIVDKALGYFIEPDKLNYYETEHTDSI